jgi:hypothetical protein
MMVIMMHRLMVYRMMDRMMMHGFMMHRMMDRMIFLGHNEPGRGKEYERSQ